LGVNVLYTEEGFNIAASFEWEKRKTKTKWRGEILASSTPIPTSSSHFSQISSPIL